jgi:ABC-type glycerol-3-phosphate transport system permease component
MRADPHPAGKRRRFITNEPVYLAIALAAAAAFAFPIFFMVSSAFKSEAEIQAIPIHWLPHEFRGLAHFIAAGTIAPLWRYFLNSMIFALTHVAATVFFGAMAGYGFAKFAFPGRGVLFFLVISTLMVPFQILVIPLFIEIGFFGWQNSYAGLIVPGLINAFGVFMMRQYAAELPDELIEAARVDGASEPYIFLRIVLPLLVPALISLGTIVFVWSWGAFLWPLVAVQDHSLYVLSIGLSGYVQPYNQEPMWGPAMAASTIATIPIACLFIFLQRYFIKGLTAAAVKG